MDARDLLDLIWLIPAAPALGAAVLLLFGKRIGEPVAGWFATAMVAASFVVSTVATVVVWTLDESERVHEAVAWTWLSVGGLEVDFGFLVDPLSLTMIMFVTGVATLIHMYSIGYMHGDPRFGRFFAYMNLFVTAMLVLVLGNNLLVTFLGWEGVGMCSYLLISFWFERSSAAVAGKKAFVTNRVGDVGFLIAMFLIFTELGTLDYVSFDAATGLSETAATVIALALLLAAAGKSAQIPLHVWLPDAMEGPTPVSALIHAATMVTAGVFLIARASVFFEVGSSAATVAAWVGAITALLAATVAVVQNDIKRVLAYSTVSQLGYMFLAVGIGAYSAGIFHMVTHASFKALLFLGAGSVIHGLDDEQDMRRMGGLRKFLPITFATYIVGWLAISGVIPLSGFWSKDEIIAKAWFDGEYALWAIGLVAALLTAYYMTRQVRLVFYGDERFRDPVPVVSGAAIDVDEDLDEPPRSTRDPHESAWTMTVPLVALAALSVLGGLLNLPFARESLEWLTSWLEPVFEGVDEIHPTSFQAGAVLSLGSLAAAVIGIAVAARVYRRGLEADGTDPTVERLGAVAPVLEHAYYFDLAIARVVGGPGRRALDWLSRSFDAGIVDGAVNGVGRLSQLGGYGLRIAQTGRLRNYALAILGGAVLLAAYMVSRLV